MTILWIVGFLVFFRVASTLFEDYDKTWFTLSGRSEDAIRMMAARANDQGLKQTMIIHDDLITDDGWLHIPVQMLFVPLALPIMRIFPLTLIWLLFNLKYKFKYKGKGFLWQVPRTRVINELMQHV